MKQICNSQNGGPGKILKVFKEGIYNVPAQYQCTRKMQKQQEFKEGVNDVFFWLEKNRFGERGDEERLLERRQ